MSNYNFGNYICELREKKGLSQSELGKILGVTNKAISKWENGGAYPSSELMLPLAKALGVSRQTISSLETGRYNPSIMLAYKIAKFFDMTIEEVFIFEDEPQQEEN
jgi:putative transcriptional regulator